MEEKRITISLSNDRKIVLLFTRPTPTAMWICQTTDECLIDMQKLLEDDKIV